MKKNYLFNLIATLTNILFPIISFPYASRVLGPIGIGKVQLAVSFAQYFTLLAAFGINVYGIQMIARNKSDYKQLSKVFSELLIINFASSMIVLFLYFGIIQYFSFFQNNIELYIYSSIIVLLGFTSIDWFYSGLEAFKIIAIRSVFIKIIALILLYSFVTTPAHYAIYLIIILFSMLGNNFINFVFIKNKVSITFKNLQLKKHLKPLLYIFGTTIAASLYTNLDILLLGFFTNDHSVGLYTSAIKLTKVAIPFITAMGLLMLPKFSIEAGKNDIVAIQKMINQSWHYVVITSVPIVFGLYLLANEFIILFSGIQFKDAISAMQIISILPFFIGVGYFFAFQILVPQGKNKEMFFSVIIGMIISIVLNYILTPILKEKGTAISSVVTEFAVTCLYFYYINKFFKFKYDWFLILKSTLASIFFIPIIWVVHLLQMNTWITLILSIVLTASSYFFIHFFVFKDLFIRTYFFNIWKRVNAK